MNHDWIDVSVTVREGMPCWPGDAPYRRQLTEAIARGDAANVSQISCSVHTGTHMDSPHHFIEDGLAIDTLPLTATVGPARVIEIKDREKIRKEEVEAHKPGRGERLLFKTRNSEELWKSDGFSQNFVYIPPDTAEFLASRGVQTVGVDYLSVGGFHQGGPETHRALLGGGVWIIEGLDLRNVEAGNYEMVCLPIKLQGSDGALARAILRRV